jgi:hypothetical protein
MTNPGYIFQVSNKRFLNIPRWRGQGVELIKYITHINQLLQTDKVFKNLFANSSAFLRMKLYGIEIIFL